MIGGGPGGYVAAIRASQLGLRTVVIEEREMGGTCLNRGCIPTKALLHAAEIYQTIRHCGEFGLSAGEISFDYQQVAARKDKVVRQLRRGVESLVHSHGGTILTGRALIRNRQEIEVSGPQPAMVRADKIIIATGSRPSRPPIPGLDGERVIDSDGALALTRCPDRAIIIGGGVIGVELATLFNGFGKQVTILEMMNSLVPGLDADLSAALRRSLEKKGVVIHTGVRVTAVENGESSVCCRFSGSGGEPLQSAAADLVIAAAGRRPNSENLGLENLGLTTIKGYIPVDDHLQTAVPGVYAIGDVIGKVQLAHAASAHGLIAAANAAGGNQKQNDAVMPACVYTSPEIAWIGRSEAQARQEGYTVRAGQFPVASNGRALTMGESEGFVKIVTDEKTGEILGAQIFGPRATELVAEMGLAMNLESTIAEVAATIHPHPTISEMLMEAAHAAEGSCVHKNPEK